MANRLEILKAVADKFPNTADGARAMLEFARAAAEFTENDAVEIRTKIDALLYKLYSPGQDAMTMRREALRQHLLETFL